MIVTVILVVLVAGALLLLARAARGQGTRGIASLVDLHGRTTAIDIAAFRNLVSAAEEDYLRRHLPPAEFRGIQRERMRAAVAYIHAALRNAAILLRLGEAAQRSSDPQLARAGATLMDTALRLRLYAFFVLLKLYVNIAFPGLRLSPTAVADRYEVLVETMARFTRLQQPALATRISLTL
jgi:hypothetical protein